MSLPRINSQKCSLAPPPSLMRSTGWWRRSSRRAPSSAADLAAGRPAGQAAVAPQSPHLAHDEAAEHVAVQLLDPVGVRLERPREQGPVLARAVHQGAPE